MIIEVFLSQQYALFFSRYSMLLPFVAGLLLFKRLSAAMRVFFVIMTVLVGFEILLSFFEKFQLSKLWVFNVAFIWQALAVNFFCYKSSSHSFFKRIMVALTLAYAVLWIIIIGLNGIQFTNPYLVAFSNLSTAICCAVLMFELVAYHDVDVLRYPEFIAALSFLIYCTMAGIIFAVLDHQPSVQNSYPNFHFYRNYIHYFVNILVNLISTYSFACIWLKRK
jgi:hypothetical protein